MTILWEFDENILTESALMRMMRSSGEQRKGELILLPLVKLTSVEQWPFVWCYFDALSALPLRNISLTVATKWCAEAGVGTAPLKMVL